MSDYDIYELSDRERAMVFTALDLYREQAEKQLDASEKKIRIYPKEIADVVSVLVGDEARFGLLHRFLPREARERAEKERAERERKEREKRLQLGIFADDVEQQTAEEALEGVEEEAEKRAAQEQEERRHAEIRAVVRDVIDDGVGFPEPYTNEQILAAVSELFAVDVAEGFANTEVDLNGRGVAIGVTVAADPARLTFDLGDGEVTLEGTELARIVREEYDVECPHESVAAEDGEPMVCDDCGAELQKVDPDDEELQAFLDEDEEPSIVEQLDELSSEGAEAEAETASDLYNRVLSVVCPTCKNHGKGAGDNCVTVGGNPRNGFHAVRVRAAVQAGVLAAEEYDAAYALETSPETEGETEAERPLTDFPDITPTLLSILHRRGITTVQDVARRWDEVQEIQGVGPRSIGVLVDVVKEHCGAELEPAQEALPV